MKKLIHKSSFEGDRSVSGVEKNTQHLIGRDSGVLKNTEDLFLRYKNYWTDGWGGIGDYPQMAREFLNWYHGSTIFKERRVFDLNHPLLKNNLKMIQDLGNFIIKEWWFNGKKFKTPGDEYLMKIINILYPAMVFQEQSNSCAIISTRYIGQNQLKVELEHDPMECYAGDGIHSDRYHD